MRRELLRSSRVFIKALLVGTAILAAPWDQGAATTSSPRSLTASAQALAIPSYFPLTPEGDADWTAMCNAAPAVGIALANVFNGPGSDGPDPVWSARIDVAHDSGILVLGYVYTGYADSAHPDFQTLAQVRAAVDAWYSWYPDIDGVFVDQTSTDPAKGQPGAYYSQLAQYIRSKPGKHLIALGQGSNAPDATYMASGDIIVNFEGSYAAFAGWTAAPWTDGFDASRFWQLVHNTPSANLAVAVAHSRSQNGGWVYTTPRDEDRWSALPVTADWHTELESAQPLSRWRASNGATTLQYRLQYANAWTFRRVYIDTDRLTSTGFLHGGIGGDFLIENDALYRYTGSGTDWSWSLIRAIPETTGGSGDGSVNWSKWDLDRSDLGTTNRTFLVFEVERSGGPLKTGAYKYEHVYSATTQPGITRYFGENDSTRFYFEANLTSRWQFRQIYVDIDNRPTTGFRMGPIGADYLIENGNLYAYSGTGTDWNWSLRGWIAHPTRSGPTYDWWVWRADLKGPGNSGLFFNQGEARLIFYANTGAPPAITPVVAQRFSP